jgi:sulfite exporter TauE/SafE/copper chaperone CopZ
MAQEHIYSVQGMHCAACEVLIEKKLLELPGVKAVDASTADGKAVVEYEGEKPTINVLNDIFRKDNYTFSDSQFIEKDNISKSSGVRNSTFFGFAITVVIVIAFLLLDKLGISGLFNISSKSSLISFFGFGILAGLSSCAALVGGMVLSLSKQWNELYLPEDSSVKKLQPHLLFNIGRILSYAIFGGVLGLIGSRLSLSFTVTAWLVIGISLIMIGLGLQMLGVKAFQRFQLGLPKFITRGIADEKRFQGKYMPFVMGALTFFLPCGFTITAQTIALLSGNIWQGAGIMGFFALGTAPMLLLIGLSSVKFFSKPHLALTFSRVAGFLVLFFALWNIYNQMNVLGLIGLN